MLLIMFKIHELRRMESIVRRIFRISNKDKRFRKVDSALYFASEFASDLSNAPSSEYNKSMAENIVRLLKYCAKSR